VLESVLSIAVNENGIGLASSYFDFAKTTNYGAVWETSQFPEFETISHIVEHQNVFWAMVKNAIYKSADYGVTWEKQMTTTSNTEIKFASFVSNENGTTGWAVGSYGFIAKYSNDLITDVESDKTQTRVTDFILWQNYPNPFNPTTEIRFTVPVLTHVSLKIYNLMGQQIATLTDAEKPSGTYAVSWDGKNRNGRAVSSGIYFYRLETNDFCKARKMLLIR
jgi:hypothetical protein